MADSDRRVELVDKPGPGQHEARLVGIGLLVGLAIGHRSLLGAISGRTAFETALGYFVLGVLVSVAGALFLGHLYQRFSAPSRADRRKRSPGSASMAELDQLSSSSSNEGPLTVENHN